jgi:hypothetical protein
MKQIKIRDLPPVGFHYPIHSLYQTEPLQESDGTPRSRYTTAWFLTKHGYFRINLSIVGPKLKEPKGEIPLSNCKPEDILKEISDLVAAFGVETLGEDTVV